MSAFIFFKSKPNLLISIRYPKFKCVKNQGFRTYDTKIIKNAIYFSAFILYDIVNNIIKGSIKVYASRRKKYEKAVCAYIRDDAYAFVRVAYRLQKR